jgi:hypothetical protein
MIDPVHVMIMFYLINYYSFKKIKLINNNLKYYHLINNVIVKGHREVIHALQVYNSKTQ